MYKYLKMLLPVAEEIGTPCKVATHYKEEYYDDSVIISGVAGEGGSFKLTLTIKDGDADA